MAFASKSRHQPLTKQLYLKPIHRILGILWVGRDLKDHSVPTHCHQPFCFWGSGFPLGKTPEIQVNAGDTGEDIYTCCMNLLCEGN